MIFSSYEFYLLFLPLCLLGYALCSKLGTRAALIFLAAASVVFYGEWSWQYVFVLLASMLFNFVISRLIAANAEKQRMQTLWLTIGIVTDLGVLAYFKYLFPWLNLYSAVTGSHHDWGSTVLPLGISFFTFTQIAYLIDLRQGIAQAEPLDRFALFVTFFPHLIAGPILHHKEMMPQFRRRAGLRSDDVAVGLTWFVMGFFKKTMLADRIAPTADAMFLHTSTAGTAESWVGMMAYSLQLYFDFSGYSDMAVGLARMFSIRFPMNFDSPYKADNIIDFWQRWHMTLTRYIMDYLYAPIQMKVSRWRMDHGKKVSKKAQATVEGMVQMIAFPTILTMFIAGVWHGSGMQFVLFGLLHGTYLTVNHIWKVKTAQKPGLRALMTKPVGVLLTYFAVLMAQVPFRAASLQDTWTVYRGMLGMHGHGDRVARTTLLLIVLLYAIVQLMPNTQEILGQQLADGAESWSLVHPRWRPSLVWWGATAVTITLCLLFSASGGAFLYFQF